MARRQAIHLDLTDMNDPDVFEVEMTHALEQALRRFENPVRPNTVFITQENPDVVWIPTTLSSLSERKPLADITRRQIRKDRRMARRMDNRRNEHGEDRSRSGATGQENEYIPPEPINTSQGLGISANTAYCVKCRQKRQMKDAKETTTKNNRKALQGICPVCGTKMKKFMK